jgi:hypothetical protein
MCLPERLDQVLARKVQQVHVLIHNRPIHVVRIAEVLADDGPVQAVVVLVQELGDSADIVSEETALL